MTAYSHARVVPHLAHSLVHFFAHLLCRASETVITSVAFNKINNKVYSRHVKYNSSQM